MKNKLIYLAVICLIALNSCDDQGQPSVNQTSSIKNKKPQNKGEFIAIVNGRGITDSAFKIFKEEFTKAHPQHVLSDQQLLQKNIDYELWAIEARNKQLHRDPDNLLRIKLLSKIFYAKRAKERFLQTHVITPQMIQKEYNKRYHEDSRQRVLLRYILQSEREKIDSMLKTLKMGGDFKKISQMAGSYKENPDEVNIATLSPNMIKAVSELGIGQYTQEAIKTDKGWLLILLEDKKVIDVPELNQVKTGIVDFLKQQQFDTHIRVLKAEAGITPTPSSE